MIVAAGLGGGAAARARSIEPLARAVRRDSATPHRRPSRSASAASRCSTSARGHRLRRPARRTPGADGRHVGLVEVAASRAGRSRAAARLSSAAPHDPHMLEPRRRPSWRHRASASCASMLGITGEPHADARLPLAARHAAIQRRPSRAHTRRSTAAAHDARRCIVTGSGYRGTGIPDCIADARADRRPARQLAVAGAGRADPISGKIAVMRSQLLRVLRPCMALAFATCSRCARRRPHAGGRADC